jgi:V8-like Glu-specific endopeptidase
MASNPADPHTPITNVSRESRPETAELSEPDTGSEAGVADAEGEVESEGAPTVTLESMELSPAPLEARTLQELPDIGTASFEDPAGLLESIIGTDERVRIPDTLKYPYRAIASLLITANDGTQYVGTAWFVSPRTLVTAGHCVFIKNSGRPNREGWVKSIQVMPGRDGIKLPFGTVTSTQFFTVKGWAETGDEAYDYAAIIVPTEVGKRVGWFGYGVFPDAELQNALINVTGYPGDKRGSEQGTLWHDSRRTAALSSTKVFYELDTMGGQSGAPAYMIRDGNRYGVAIHAYGGATSNSGTRITPAVMKNLNAWRR